MALDNNTWITVFMLVVLALGGGSFLYLTPEGFTLEIDGDTKFKLKNDILKAYEGRSLVYSDQIQPYYYNSDRRSYVKMYRQRGEKYSELSYRNEGNVYYLKKDSYYSQGTLTRYYTITKSGIQKTAFKWNPDNPDLRTYFIWRYKDMDSLDDKIVYLDKTKKGSRAEIDNGYIIDWSTEVDNLVRVERFKNGNLQLRTRIYEGKAEFDPFIFTNGKAGDAVAFADGLEVKFKQEIVNGTDVNETMNVTKAWLNATVWRWNGTNWTSPSAGISVWYNDSIYKWGTDILDNQTDNLMAIVYNASHTVSYQRLIYKMDVPYYGIIVLDHNDLCSETENGTVTRNCSYVSINGLHGIQFNVNKSFDPTITLINGTDFDASFTINMTAPAEFSSLLVNDSSIVGFWNFDADGQEKRPQGQVKTAMDFDGNGDSVIAKSANFTTFTVSAWVNTDSVQDAFGFPRFVAKGFNSVFDFGLRDSDNAIFLTINDGISQTFSTDKLTDGKWHYVAGKYNISHLTLYVDGVEQTPTSVSVTLNQTSENLVIGSTTTPRDFNGLIDEVMLFNRSLSALEITGIFSVNSQGLSSTIDGGKIAHYKFDEFTGQNVIDSSSNSLNGTASFLPSKAYDFTTNDNQGTYIGDANNNATFKELALNLDGTGDLVSIGAITPLVNYTISLWFNIVNASVESSLFVSESNAAGNGIDIRVESTSTIKFRSGGANDFIVTAAIINSNEWFNVISTFDGTNQTIYINGVLNVTGAGIVPISTFFDSPLIGAFISTGTIIPFNGFMDDVIIYNRTLNAIEALAIFNNQSPTYFSSGTQTFTSVDFNASGCTGTALCDSVILNNSLLVVEPTGSDARLRLDFWQGNTTDGYNTTQSIASSLVAYWTGDGSAKDELGLHDGTFVNNANASNDGIYDNAFGLDGISKFVSTNFIISNDSFTISMWINPTSFISGSGRTISARSGIKGIDFFISGPSGGLSALYGDGSAFVIRGGGTVNLNEFSHLTYAISREDGEICIYINGVLQNCGDISTITGTVNSSATKILIGTFTGVDFNGSIDDVMIFNKSLSSTEAKQIYTRGLANWQTGETKSGNKNQIYNLTNKTENILPIIVMTSSSTETPFYKSDSIGAEAVTQDDFPNEDVNGNSFFDVKNCIQLENMAANLTRNYEMVNDIDCSGIPNFTPIGSFGGDVYDKHFKGNNFTISNFKTNDSGGFFRGLFGQITGNFTDVKLDNSTFIGSFGAGLLGTPGSTPGLNVDNVFMNNTRLVCPSGSCASLISFSLGNIGTVSNIDIQNMILDAGDSNVGGVMSFLDGRYKFINITVSKSTINGTSNVGGIVGFSRNEGSSMDNVSFTGNLNGLTKVAGIIAESDETNFTNVHANANITCTGTGPSDICGIFGGLMDSAILIDSSTQGNLNIARFGSGFIGRLGYSLADDNIYRNLFTNVTINTTLGQSAGFSVSRDIAPSLFSKQMIFDNISSEVTFVGNTTNTSGISLHYRFNGTINNSYSLIDPMFTSTRGDNLTLLERLLPEERVLEANGTTYSIPLPTELTYTGSSNGTIVGKNLTGSIITNETIIVQINTTLRNYNITINLTFTGEATTTVPLFDFFNLSLITEALNPAQFIYSLGFELNTTNFTGIAQAAAGVIVPSGLSTAIVASFPVSVQGVIFNDFFTQMTKAEMGNINTLPDIVNRSFSIMFRLAGGVGSDPTELPINITKAILNLGADAELDKNSLLLTQGTFNGGTTDSNVAFSVE